MVLIIGTGTLTRGCLKGEVVVITGSGRGIGLEAARSLAWLGSKVVIAEIDESTGSKVESEICREFGPGSALFVRTDVSKEDSVQALKKEVESKLGHADTVINNATAFRMGAVTHVGIDGWDLAYGVNIRGPVLLAQAFVPGMVSRDHGNFLCVSSSGAAPYMGAYEVFKTAQVELARVLDAEMEGRKVNVLTIGPGLVRTPGSSEGIAALAPLYNKSVEEFFAMSKEAMLTAEEAGAGFAAAVALAERFRGQEISSYAALSAIGLTVGKGPEAAVGTMDDQQWSRASSLIGRALRDLEAQHKGWMEMVVFKRQWILRDFKKGAGMPVEQWMATLRSLNAAISDRDPGKIAAIGPRFDLLIAQYSHMRAMLEDYEKDPAKLDSGRKAIRQWIGDLEGLKAALAPIQRAG